MKTMVWKGIEIPTITKDFLSTSFALSITAGPWDKCALEKQHLSMKVDFRPETTGRKHIKVQDWEMQSGKAEAGLPGG